MTFVALTLYALGALLMAYLVRVATVFDERMRGYPVQVRDVVTFACMTFWPLVVVWMALSMNRRKA